MDGNQHNTEVNPTLPVKELSSSPLDQNPKNESQKDVSKRIKEVVSSLRFWRSQKKPDEAFAILAQQDSTIESSQRENNMPQHEDPAREEVSRNEEYKISITDTNGAEIPKFNDKESIMQVGLWTSVTKASLRIWNSVKDHPDSALVFTAAALGGLSMISGSNPAAELSTIIGGFSIGLGVAEKGLLGTTNGEIDTKRKLLGALIGGVTLYAGSELITMTMGDVSESIGKYIGINSHLSESTQNTVRILSGFADDAAIGTKTVYQTLKNFAKVN